MSNDEKQTMTITEVARAILSGEVDSHLDVIMQAIKERRDAQARLTFLTLKPGDRVRFKSAARPKYLAGKMGTLVDLRDNRVTVDLDNQQTGRFSCGIVTPVTLIEKVVAIEEKTSDKVD
jgi:hypothetical protein